MPAAFQTRKLGDIQPDHWRSEYTTELLNVLPVLALLVEMEPDQAKLLEAICKGPILGTIDDLIAEIAGIPIEELAKEPTADGRHLISVDELRAAGALDVPAAWRKSLATESRYTLPGFDDEQKSDSQSASDEEQVEPMETE